MIPLSTCLSQLYEEYSGKTRFLRVFFFLPLILLPIVYTLGHDACILIRSISLLFPLFLSSQPQLSPQPLPPPGFCPCWLSQAQPTSTSLFPAFLCFLTLLPPGFPLLLPVLAFSPTSIASWLPPLPALPPYRFPFAPLPSPQLSLLSPSPIQLSPPLPPSFLSSSLQPPSFPASSPGPGFPSILLALAFPTTSAASWLLLLPDLLAPAYLCSAVYQLSSVSWPLAFSAASRLPCQLFIPSLPSLFFLLAFLCSTAQPPAFSTTSATSHFPASYPGPSLPPLHCLPARPQPCLLIMAYLPTFLSPNIFFSSAQGPKCPLVIKHPPSHQAIQVLAHNH